MAEEAPPGIVGSRRPAGRADWLKLRPPGPRPWPPKPSGAAAVIVAAGHAPGVSTPLVPPGAGVQSAAGLEQSLLTLLLLLLTRLISNSSIGSGTPFSAKVPAALPQTTT